MVEMIHHTGGPGSERRTDLRLAFKPSRYPALSALMDDPKYSRQVLLAAAEIGAVYLLATDEERSQMLSGLSARIKADFDESVERVASNNLLADDERAPSKKPQRPGPTAFTRQSQSPLKTSPTITQTVPIFDRSQANSEKQIIPRGITGSDQVPMHTPNPQASNPQTAATVTGARRVLDMYSETFTADDHGDE